MKPIYYLIILFCCQFSFAQEEKPVLVDDYSPQNPWSFGLKGGVNFASIKGSYVDLDYVNKLEGMIGIHGAAWANYSFNEKMALQFELMGSLQGGDVVYNEIEFPVTGEMIEPTGEMRLPYIIVPVLFQYEPVKNWYVEAGPQINFLLKVNVNALFNGEEVDNESINEIVTNRLANARTVDVGLNIGTGYKFAKNWAVYTRYTHGLITVDNREENQRDLKNRVFAVGVAYTIK